jgi:hypothetical protein
MLNGFRFALIFISCVLGCARVDGAKVDNIELQGLDAKLNSMHGSYNKKKAEGSPYPLKDSKLESAKSDCSQLYKVGSKDYGSCVMKLLD